MRGDWLVRANMGGMEKIELYSEPRRTVSLSWEPYVCPGPFWTFSNMEGLSRGFHCLSCLGTS